MQQILGRSKGSPTQTSTSGSPVTVIHITDQSGDVSTDSSSAELPEPTRKKKKTPKSAVKMQTLHGVIDEAVRDKLVGVFDVHVECLIEPQGGRAARDVNFSHVSLLQASFQEDMDQTVMLVGMLTEHVDNPTDFHQPTGPKLETLGGNHTRMALQALHKNKRLSVPTVKVKVYQPLTRTEALAQGFKHNDTLDSKKKRRPMSFIDKVKLMRSMKPSDEMTNKEVADWKEELCVVFRQPDPSKLQVNNCTQLQMARVPADLWQKVLVWEERSKEPISERFFKSMLSISPEEHHHTCIDVLIEQGKSAFNATVAKFVEKGMTRRPKKKKGANNLDAIDIEHEDQLVAQEDLQDRIDQLEHEKLELMDQLTLLKENKKRPVENEESVHSKKRQVGDRVEAKWKNSNWYPAEIMKISYQVKYFSDNKTQTILIENLDEEIRDLPTDEVEDSYHSDSYT